MEQLKFAANLPTDVIGHCSNPKPYMHNTLTHNFLCLLYNHL